MPPPFSMAGEFETEEWWFDDHPKGVGKRRPRPIDELFSESSESSSTLHTTTTRWYEAFETRVAPSQSTRQSEVVKSLRHQAATEVIWTFGFRPDARKRTSSLPSFRV